MVTVVAVMPGTGPELGPAVVAVPPAAAVVVGAADFELLPHPAATRPMTAKPTANGSRRRSDIPKPPA